MKIISWNVRGSGRLQTVKRLRQMLKLHNPQMVFFMETKINSRQIEKIRVSYGFFNGIDVSSEGTRGGLCLAWRNDINVQLQSYSKRHIDVIIDEGEERYKWRFTGFYGSPYSQERNEAWNLL